MDDNEAIRFLEQKIERLEDRKKAFEQFGYNRQVKFIVYGTFESTLAELAATNKAILALKERNYEYES